MKWRWWYITTPWNSKGGIRGIGNYLLYISQDAWLKGEMPATVASAENTK